MLTADYADIADKDKDKQDSPITYHRSLSYLRHPRHPRFHCLGICRRRYESKSVRVISPRNLSPSMTMATRPRSNTSSKSLIFALGGSVSRRSVIAFFTGSLKCIESRCTFTSKSDSSRMPRERHL